MFNDMTLRNAAVDVCGDESENYCERHGNPRPCRQCEWLDWELTLLGVVPDGVEIGPVPDGWEPPF
jgi:hypothetical protein